MSVALAFPDQERYRTTNEVCWRCGKRPLIAKSIPNGELMLCPHCHREAEVRSLSPP